MKRCILGAVAGLAVLCAAGPSGCEDTGRVPASEVGEGVIEVVPDGTAEEPSQAAIEAHVSALTADAVLAAALARLADEGVEQTLYTGPDAADRLRRNLIIEAIPETRLISVRLPGAPAGAGRVIPRQKACTKPGSVSRPSFAGKSPTVCR